jgi:hypothetical protein
MTGFFENFPYGVEAVFFKKLEYCNLLNWQACKK